MKKYKKDDIYYACYKKRNTDDDFKVGPFYISEYHYVEIKEKNGDKEKWTKLRSLFNDNLIGLLNSDNKNEEYFRTTYEYGEVVRTTSNIEIFKIYSFSEIILLLNEIAISNSKIDNTGIDRVKLLSKNKVSVNDIIKINDIVNQHKKEFGFEYIDESEEEKSAVKTK